jgi:hypothetical protein
MPGQIAAGLLVSPYYLEAAHIGLQHVRHGDRAVFLVVIFHLLELRPDHRRSRTVEGM